MVGVVDEDLSGDWIGSRIVVGVGVRMGVG